MARTLTATWRHFRQRLGERYGIHNMTYEEWLALRLQIIKGHKDHFVGRSSNTKTWWIVNYKKGRILALYDSKISGFLSCLPLTKLDKALDGNMSIRNYLGIHPDNVMLRNHNGRRFEETRDLA